MGSLMDNQESIYNLVPPGPVAVSKKLPIPKAKYDPIKDIFMTHFPEQRLAATFGHPIGSLKPHTNMYLRKHSKEPYHKAPKKLPKSMPDYAEKKNYGKVPAYLVRFNEILKKKHQKLDVLSHKQEVLGDHPNARRLEEGERQELIEMLKQKWQHVNEAYQKISFTLDTPAKKCRKEQYEEQLMQIEKDILTLSRRVVLVVDKGKSQSSSSHSDRYKRQFASHL